MVIIKCDLCKKTIHPPREGYTLKISSNYSLINLESSHDICKDCYMDLCKKLRNTEENEDGNTES